VVAKGALATKTGSGFAAVRRIDGAPNFGPETTTMMKSLAPSMAS